MAKYFTDSNGINYQDFLARVAPRPALEDLYQTSRSARLTATERRAANSVEAHVDPHAVLEKVVIQVCQS